jgi:hypothetical protein
MSTELERVASSKVGRKLASKELASLAQAAIRIEGTYNLAEYAAHRATRLNRAVKQQSHDNPGLEMILREFENTAAVVTGLVMYNYGTGR